jgi:hypothetical protein
MKCLMVIPTTMHNYSFSAPLAWMFAGREETVTGIYGFELTEKLVTSYDFFIIELNWFIQLTEFSLLVEYIKKHNRGARILFGGLYSALKYKEIFQRYEVDYFIQGSNEMPMEMLLNDADPKKIPNMIGRDFENPITYLFKEEDYKNLEYGLEWFPSYYRYREPGQMYELPMLITNKGGCTSIHKECDYCMGAKHEALRKIYRHSPIVMSNRTLMGQLEKVEKKFDRASLIVLSECNYNFSNRYFDIDMNVEIDSPVAIEKISEILYAFRKCVLNISVYEEGLCGDAVRDNFQDIIEREDEDHHVRFFAYDREAVRLNIPEDHIMPSEDVLPEWAYWNFYMNMEQALLFSGLFYSKLGSSRKFPVQAQEHVPDIEFDLD